MLKISEVLYAPPVGEEQKGRRVDRFLAEAFPQLSRTQIQRLIAAGNAEADDFAIPDSSFKTRLGDAYQITVPSPEDADPEPQDIPLDAVYEDDDLIVINKPAGMVVHPGAGVREGTLVNALLFHCAGSLSGIGGVKRPGIVHRIDKDTSGLLVAAKNDLAHQGLSEQFAEHSVGRVYHAFCFGLPNPLSGTIEGNIGRAPQNRQKMALVKSGGKPAITHYKTLKSIEGGIAAKIECRLETGRTHQIRVHLASIGNPLIGDALYAPNRRIKEKTATAEALNAFPRQALHAKTLSFVHPRTGERLGFDSELPEDMRRLDEL